MAPSRRSPGSGHGVGVMLAQDVPLASRSCFAFSSRSPFAYKLATSYASRLLQLHIYFALSIPMSLNSLDRVGVRLLSPCGSQILQLQMQVQVILLQLTITSSGGSSTRTLSDTTYLFRMISSGA